MAAIDLAGILKSMTAERTQKYGEGLGQLQQLLQLFGNQYSSGQERTALAGIEQSAVGRGLSNTTVPVAASAITKAGFEDIRKSRLADALKSITGYIQGGTPTAGEISHLATGGFSGLLAEKEFKASQAPAIPMSVASASGGRSGSRPRSWGGSGSGMRPRSWGY